MVEAVRFPDIRLYSGWAAPMRAETTLHDLEVVQGEVPAELDGVWYRAGPDRQYPSGRTDDVFIDGEGMVHRIAFRRGRVDYASRWVRNTRFELQAKAGRALFGRYRNRYTNDPSVAGVSMGTANTTPVWHAGKLLVLKEDDLPWEVDPDTLETIGRYDYGGQVKAQTLSAHPKHDLTRDELNTFSYMATGDGSLDVVFYTIDADGKVIREIPFQAPWPSMMHDFALTEHYAVFFFGSLITDLETIKAGGPFYRYHPDREARIAILPRDGTAADIRWFTGPGFTTSHTLNAYEEGRRVHVDLTYYDGNAFPFFPTPDGATGAGVPPMLTRLSFDLAGNADSYERRLLSPIPGELPRIDDRFHGRPYRHGWRIGSASPPDPEDTAALDTPSILIHDDLVTGAPEVWSPGPDCGLHEIQFVPRRLDAPEGDGWLLVLVNRLNENRNDLVVLDALDLAAGPVATVKMPVKVRMTFHGCWTPSKALATGRHDLYSPAPTEG